MNITKLDQLLQALDRAARITEALKTEIAGKDKSGIAPMGVELAHAIKAIDKLGKEIMEELSR